MLLTGIGAGILSGVAAATAVRSAGFLATLFGWTAAGAALVTLYGLGMAGYMTYSSKVGKRRDAASAYSTLPALSSRGRGARPSSTSVPAEGPYWSARPALRQASAPPGAGR